MDKLVFPFALLLFFYYFEINARISWEEITLSKLNCSNEQSAREWNYGSRLNGSRYRSHVKANVEHLIISLLLSPSIICLLISTFIYFSPLYSFSTSRTSIYTHWWTFFNRLHAASHFVFFFILFHFCACWLFNAIFLLHFVLLARITINSSKKI